MELIQSTQLLKLHIPGSQTLQIIGVVAKGKYMHQERVNVIYLSNSSIIEQQREEDEDYCVWDDDDIK